MFRFSKEMAFFSLKSYLHRWLSAGKNLRGQKTIELFLTQQAIFPIVLSIIFENFRGAKVVLGGPAPCSRKPASIFLVQIRHQRPKIDSSAN